MAAAHLRLTPDDLAAAYKQLLAVERGWRDMKGALGLRPVFHYREDRIRAHVQLCWLALLLPGVIENTTGDTWRNIRHELDRLHLVTLATNHGRVAHAPRSPPGRKPSSPHSSCPNHPASSTSPPPPPDQTVDRTANPCSNTTPTRLHAIIPGHTRVPETHVPISCGSPVRCLICPRSAFASPSTSWCPGGVSAG